MIREPYIGMPIQIGCMPGTMPGRPVQPAPTPPAPTPPAPNPGPPSSGPVTGGNPTCAQTAGFDTQLLGTLPLAMTYVPMQQWKSAYPPSEALMYGTLFPDLNLPFEGRKLR